MSCKAVDVMKYADDDAAFARARHTIDLLLEDVRAVEEGVKRRASTARMRAVRPEAVAHSSQSAPPRNESRICSPVPQSIPISSDEPPPVRTRPPEADAGRYALITPRRR